MNIDSAAKLNCGISIPYLGLGVYKAPQDITKQAVLWALDAGYRHIDTAKMYGNERQVGQAIRESNISREEIFVTTKLWNSDQGYDSTLAAFDKSLKSLDIDYIDLYLIHWPVKGLRSESWKALQHIFKEGQCKSIGVSNYTVNHLKEVIDSDYADFDGIEKTDQLKRTVIAQWIDAYRSIAQGQLVMEEQDIQTQMRENFDNIQSAFIGEEQ